MNITPLVAMTTTLFATLVSLTPTASASPPTQPTTAPLWSALSPADLLWLAKGLTGSDDATKGLRARMVEHLTAAYLADPSRTTKVSVAQWSEFAQCLVGDMSQETKLLWAGKLRLAFPDRSPASAQSTGLASAVKALGVVPDLVASATQDTQAAPNIPDLLWLARNLTSSDPDKQARQQVIDYLGNRVFSSREAVRSVSTTQWQAFAAVLGKDLPAPIRSAWTARLRDAFAANSQAVTGMNLSTLKDFSKTLQAFGDEDPSGVAVTFLAVSTAWQSWEMPDLVALSEILSYSKGDRTRDARLRLADHVQRKYLASSTDIASVGLQGWNDLARHLGGGLPEATRALWAQKLREGFAPTKQALLGLPARDAKQFAEALKTLGDLQVPSLLATWVTGTSSWQSFSAGDVAWLAESVNDYTSEGEAAGRLLLDHVSSAYLATQEATRSVSCGDWERLVKHLGTYLSPEARTLWVTVLLEAFARTDQDIIGLRGYQLTPLARAVWALEPRKASNLALTWLSEADNWQKVSRADLASIIAFAVAAEKAERVVLMYRLDRTLTAEGVGDLGWQECASISLAWLRMGDKPKAQEWAMRVYNHFLGTEEARATVTPDGLADAAFVLWQVGLVRKDKSYSSFAQALADLARRGELVVSNISNRERYYGYFALPLTTPEAQNTVQAELVGPDGLPRVPVAKVLSYFHRGQDALRPWWGFLDGKVTSSQGSPDAQALWLVARGHAAALLHLPADLKLAVPWLNKALATPASDTVRWSVLVETIDCYRAVKEPTLAASLLDSVKDQFLNQSDAAASLRSELLREAADLQAKIARENAAVDAARKRAMLKYYRDRLSLARSVNDQGKVARLEASIQDLEKQMNP